MQAAAELSILRDIRVVLVSPKRPANIGAVCRAADNFEVLHVPTLRAGPPPGCCNELLPAYVQLQQKEGLHDTQVDEVWAVQPRCDVFSDEAVKVTLASSLTWLPIQWRAPAPVL